VIKRLHHNAYRCRDSEETRGFYEDFLGLPLTCALEIRQTKTARSVKLLHTFYALNDGSFLAFFEVPDTPFDFRPRHDYDLHIALEVDESTLAPMLARGRSQNICSRGISDHSMVKSIYFEDPNGYVIELTAKTALHDITMNPNLNGARQKLIAWQARKSTPHA
jgi:catechol 2,3-dioxygenase-like lactoylglutathione lyase family enzyme